jgi:hypothetical protein
VWRRIVRFVLSPLLGIGIVVHEVFLVKEPRELAVIAGLVLLGVPLDSAAKLLGRPTDSDASSSTTPRRPPSSSEE